MCYSSASVLLTPFFIDYLSSLIMCMYLLYVIKLIKLKNDDKNLFVAKYKLGSSSSASNLS